MSLEDIINNKLAHWVAGDGPENSIVLSSRIRLARNLENNIFPNRASSDEKEEVLKKIKNISIDKANKLHFIDLLNLPELEKTLLVEKNLISPEQSQKGKGSGVLLSENESISIMINEEDHIRLQVLLPGLQLEKAWSTASGIDDLFEDKLDIAFSEQWGYLTSCPTNTGTALRASVMVHIPALYLTKNIDRMLEAVSKLGLAVRGLYGEGSESSGNIYQISNQVTLGRTEDDIIDNLKGVTEQIMEQEKQARKSLLEKKEIDLKDRICRSLGTLKYAYRISSREAMELLSNVKLGIDLDLIKEVDRRLLSQLLILIRPAHIQKINGRELNSIDRDIKRADLIQTRLNM